MDDPRPDPPERRSLVGRRGLVVVCTLVLAVALAAWGWREQQIRAVLEPPLIARIADSSGWEITGDLRFRAGLVDRMLLGGMITDPLQRQVTFATGEPRAGVQQVLLEEHLFGERGVPNEFVQDGIAWERRLTGRSLTYHGRPVGPAGTRLERITVTSAPETVIVRTFGR